MASKAIIKGEITAESGRIGFLDVDLNSLTLGQNQDAPTDPWTAGMNVVAFYSQYFLYRINGDNRGQIRELAFNLYSNNLGSFQTEASRSTNSITNNEFGNGVNVAHSFSAANADRNIAIDIIDGEVAGLNLHTRQINSNTTLTRRDVWISSYNTAGITLTLPSSPNVGKVLYIRQMNSFGITFNGNGINIHVAGDVGTTYTNTNSNIGDCHKFVYDGQFWCYNQIYREAP